MDYRESIDWLFSTQLFGIKLGLDGPRRFLREALAYPAHGVTVIQVAGTNGKGSTCAMIDAISRACGRRTGLFTSPHLVDFRERVRVSGVEMPEEAVAERLTALRGLCERLEPHPTFFEITLVLAMQWFRRTECEVIVLETGMGGRFDATTAVPADVSVITPVGMDHMQHLGDTVEKIAMEKAGIFRVGKPAVSAPQEAGVRRVLEMEANQVRAPLEFVDAPLLGYPLALRGAHQRWNAALAVAALRLAGVGIRFDSLQYGLQTVRWPGRFEVFAAGSVPGVRGVVVLDGAHNPHAAEVLAATWREQYAGSKPVMVFSAVAAKDIGGMLAILAPLAAEILLCPVDSPRAVGVDELAGYLPAGAPPHRLYDSFDAAFADAVADGRDVLIAGSLFLVGEARARLAGGDFRSSSQ